ncbi:hypothetical protein [Cellulomonas sp. SG140]|uniref:hypothetical protein n=1 Tax=Cellulomonas sp. SG140 TaxID=2976536 RepID=UPI0021E844B5|nr:hypothetical protein [Cellulomonas sp. SG140]
MDDRATTPTEVGTVRAPRWWRRFVALFVSPDFYVGVPVGLVLGGLPVKYSDVAGQVTTVLLAASGIAAALGALVLTAMTVLLGVFGTAYRAMLARVPGGIAGTLVPYRQVVGLSAAASVTALVAAILWPALAHTPPILRWADAGVPLALLVWAILGCVQVVGQLVQHVENNQRAEDLARRKAEAIAKGQGRLAEIERRDRSGE